MILKYTLCLIKQGSKILLLNREKPSWMGCWNGIGGKIESHEQPRASMLRELEEETGILYCDLYFKGLITWSYEDGSDFGGLYLYLAELPVEIEYITPKKTDEGILDWKEIDWILDPKNQGIAHNIPPCLEKVVYDEKCYHHHSIFSKERFVRQISSIVDERIETDDTIRNEYLQQYINDHQKRTAVGSKS